MPKLSITIRSNALPPVWVTGKVETLADARRFLRAMDKALGRVGRLFKGALEHKVISIGVKPE